MSVGKKTMTGVKWASLAKFTNIGVGILRISILTRFLQKEDFGLIALVYIVVGFAELFMDMGLSTAILHKQNISQKEYSSLYWFNFMFSFFLFLMICLSSTWFADFYNQPALKILTPLVAVNIILSAIGRQFSTVLQKELNFFVISIVEIVAAVLSMILAVVLAMYGFGVYALAYSTLMQFGALNLLFLFLCYKKHPIKAHFSLKETLPFLKIGIYQVGGQMINYFSKELDVFIIGKAIGTVPLGSYNLAKQLAIKPTTFINPIITEVASPLLAAMQGDKQKLKENYVKLIKMTSIVTFNIFLLIFIFSDLIIYILYGSDYRECVVLLRLFCVYMYLRGIHNPIGSLLVATGRTDLDLKWQILYLAATVIMLYIGSFFGIMGILYSFIALILIMIVPAWYIFYKGLLDLSLKDYLRAVIVSKEHYTFLFDVLKQNIPFYKKKAVVNG
jgi:O-antigen/teichoic acid export membrane protein